MRYLYGDSAPFQLQYNFLATLEDFVGCGARAVRLEREVLELRARNLAAQETRRHSLSELTSFHGANVEAIRACAKHATSADTLEFARKVDEYAGRLLEEARRDAEQAADREAEIERVEAGRRADEARHAVESFLLVGRLPTLEAKVSLDLAHGENHVRAVFYNPLRIVTSFALDPKRAPAWRRERKVSDFARGVTAQVGMKRSLFKRTSQPDVMELDDLFVGGFDLANDAAEIRLRKRPDAKDLLVFRVARSSTGLTGEVTREGEDEAAPLDASDVVEIEKLWQPLRAAAGEMLLHRERLLGVQLDEVDLFAGSVTPFFERVVKLFAPLVAEISKRSPNPAELSLKVEDDAGRREEIYLRKKDLLDKLVGLDEPGRDVFAPLFDERRVGRDELPSLDVSLDTMDEI